MRMAPVRVALLLTGLCLLLAGCEKSPPTGSRPAPSASAGSAGSPVAAAPPPVVRTFHEALRSAGPVAFSALGPVSLVRAGDVAFRVEGGKLVQDPADAVLSRAKSYGTWPKDVVAEVLIERAEMDPHVGAGKLEGKALTTLVTPGESESTTFLVRTAGDQWLAAVQSGRLDWRWAHVSPKTGPTPATLGSEKPEGPCKTPFLPDEGYGDVDGVIVAAGFPCAAQRTGRLPYIARWTADAKEPSLLKLDNVKTSTGRMLVAGRRGHPVYVAHQTEAVLFGSDGGTFSPISVPGPISAIALSPDGTLFAAVDGVLHERKSGGTLAAITTPFAVESVWVADDGKLWLTALAAGDAAEPREGPAPAGVPAQGRVLFTDAFAPRRIIVAPTSAAVELAREEGIELGTDGCATLSLRVLTGVAKGQKLPLLADLVKELGDASGITFVFDEVAKGKLAITALVPDVATGRKLAEAVGSKASGAKSKSTRPKVACRAPVDRGPVVITP